MKLITTPLLILKFISIEQKIEKKRNKKENFFKVCLHSIYSIIAEKRRKRNIKLIPYFA
jgi:hypothetical protein